MTSNILPPEIIERLQKDYIASFEEKVQHLESALQKKDWLELYNIFHKLAGSGATYYMPEISFLGRHAEKYFKLCPKPEFQVAAESVGLMKEIFEARKSGSSLEIEHHPVIARLR